MGTNRRRWLLLTLVGTLAAGGAAVVARSILRTPPQRNDEGARSGDPARSPGPSEDPRLRGTEAAPAEASTDLLPLGEAPPGGIGVLVSVQRWESGTFRTPAGVRVRLRLDAPEPVVFAPLEVETDDRGQVRFGPFPVPRVPRRLATRAALVAEFADGRTQADFWWVVRSEGRVDARGPAGADPVRWFEVSLRSDGGVFVAGHVVAPDGTPVPNVHVHLGERWRGSWSDDDGAFSLVAPTPGRQELRATLEVGEEHDAAAVLPVDVPAEGLYGVRVVLDGVGRIAGRLVESDGRPAAGAEVVLTPPGRTAGDLELQALFSSGDFGLQRLARRVAANGTFSVAGTTNGGRYDVRSFVAPDTEQVLAEAVASGSTELELRIDRHGVRTRAVDTRDGLPVYGELHVRTATEALGPVSDPLHLRAGSSEEFLAPSGTAVTILARARGYADAVVHHTVSATPGLDDVVLRLRPADPAFIVRIRCVDERGVPRPWPPTRWKHAPTGVALGIAGDVEDGVFSETLLPAGAYVLSCAAAAPGEPDRFRGPHSQVFDVPPEGLPDAVWKVPTGGALRITFLSQDGATIEPGDMRSVRAKGDGDEFQIDLFHRRADGAWQEGTGAAVPYETRTLLPGTYDVTWYDRGEGGSALATVRVEVVAGSLTHVEFRR